MTVPPSPVDQPARRAARLPIVIWLVALALAMVQLWMILATQGQPTPGLWGVTGWELVFGLMFGTVGAVIAARRPDNRVGWLMLMVGLGVCATGFVNWYPVLSDARPDALPLVEIVRWTSAWAWVVFAPAGIVFLPLIFPDGHLPSPRWRPVAVLALVAMITTIAAIILAVAPIGSLKPAPLDAVASESTGPLLLVGYALVVTAAAAAGASLVYRYRHADQVMRQQIKWVAYSFALLVPTVALGLSALLIFTVLELAAVTVVVVSIAIAVLRYRLYEIDQIINRTLVYGFLTAILAGVYTASITLTQKVFQALTNERSDASIVLTTLIVVSLFTPLKTRLQAMVDKRLKTVEPAKATAAMADSAAGVLDTLTRLDGMRVAGIVTQAEFEAKKQELLSRV